MDEVKKKDNPLYSESAYDDAFRTMEGRCDDLLIPLVSHMFREKYGKSAVVKRLRNEQFVEHEDGSEEKRITDSSFEITYKNITKRYHLECESKVYSRSMLVRIFEYDTQIAKNAYEINVHKVKFRFPNSGLLLLRFSKEAPETGIIELVMPDGKEVSYEIPMLKMSDYSIDKIFEEKLFMLIPFYIFNFEKKLPEMNQDMDQIDELLKNYEEIFDRLDNELAKGSLSSASYDAIIRLTHSVAYKLTTKQENVQKKVGDVMGGKVLDLPGFRIYDEGKEEGFKEGKEEGIKEGKEEGIKAFIEDKIEDNVPADQIISKLIKRFELTEDKAREYAVKYGVKLEK